MFCANFRITPSDLSLSIPSTNCHVHSQQGLRIDPSDGRIGFSLCLKQVDLSEDFR
jgi:hypothetical protein